MFRRIVFLIALVLLATPLRAQYVNPDASLSFAVSQESTDKAFMVAEYKDPQTAQIISFVIPGGGQYWAGDTSRGLKILAVGWGAPVVGSILASTLCVSGSGGACGVGALVYLAGVGTGLGAWVYGILDADDTAKRMNEKNGAVQALLPAGLAPVVTTTASGATGVGLQFTVR